MFYGNYDYCSSCYRICSSDRKQRFTLQIRRMKSQKFRNTQCNTALEYHRDGREKRLLFRNNITRMGCTRSDSCTPFYFAVHSLVTYHLRHIVTPSFPFPLVTSFPAPYVLPLKSPLPPHHPFLLLSLTQKLRLKEPTLRLVNDFILKKFSPIILFH